VFFQSAKFKQLETSASVAPESVYRHNVGPQTIAMDSFQHQIYKLSSLATRSIFQPQLKFIQVKIFVFQTSFSVKALVDSGCAKTAISSTLFKHFQSVHPSLQTTKVIFVSKLVTVQLMALKVQ